MKKGFTLIEVSILFIIFLIVAFLVAPLSVDDTIQAKNISKWRAVQEDFSNIFYSINTQKTEADVAFKEAFETIMNSEYKEAVKPYKITYLNGTYPSNTYRFKEYNLTHAKAVISVKFFDEVKNDLQGMVMYDVNGTAGPNSWGKDIFGLNIYSDRFEPFGKHDSLNSQKQDCSKNGTGLSCSNYYLIGGSFD